MAFPEFPHNDATAAFRLDHPAETPRTTADRLRDAIRQLDPDHANEIREAYYKASEGLARLDSLLSEADEVTRGLAGEKHHVSTARKEFGRCQLGRIL